MATSALMPNNRDAAVLKMVYGYGAVSAELIRHRFWPNQTAGARAACYRRIALLVDGGLLSATRLPALHGRGSGKALLTLGPAGRQLLADTLDVPIAELRRVRLQSPSAFEHHLATCSIRLSFELACEYSFLFAIEQWGVDGAVSMRVKDPKTSKNVTLIPDASITLALSDGRRQLFYLELDRGTLTDLNRLKAKLRGYLALAKDNPTPVLWVVPDSKRQAAIAEHVRSEAAGLKTDSTIFWLTSLPRINEHSVLSDAIWQIVGGPTVAFSSLAADGTQPAPPSAPSSASFTGVALS